MHMKNVSIVQGLWVRLLLSVFSFLRRLYNLKNYLISSARCKGQLDLTKYHSLSVISNKSGLLIQSNRRDRILPVWATLFTVDSRMRNSPTMFHKPFSS